MKISEQKREDILSGAIDEFKEHGYTAARTSRIAKRAGVSSRTLYKHFEGKEALFAAIMDKFFKMAGFSSELVLDENRSLREQLIETVEQFIDSINDESMLTLNRIAMVEFMRDRELAGRVIEKNSCCIGPLHSLISQAMEKGLIRRDDVRYASEKLIALIKSFFFFPMLLLGEFRNVEQPRSRVVADCVDMFLSHYKLD